MLDTYLSHRRSAHEIIRFRNDENRDKLLDNTHVEHRPGLWAESRRHDAGGDGVHERSERGEKGPPDPQGPHPGRRPMELRGSKQDVEGEEEDRSEDIRPRELHVATVHPQEADGRQVVDKVLVGRGEHRHDQHGGEAGHEGQPQPPLDPVPGHVGAQTRHGAQVGDGGEPGDSEHYFPVVPGHAARGGAVSADQDGDAADDLEVAEDHDHLLQVRTVVVSVSCEGLIFLYYLLPR